MEPIEKDESKEPFSKDELQVLKDARAIEDMTRTPGWAVLMKWADEKSEGWHKELMAEVKKDYTLERDLWLKGALFGVQYYIGLPSVVIAQARDMRSAKAEETEE